MRKECFQPKGGLKLHLRRDVPFQVLEKTNDLTYKLDHPDEYNISATFDVTDIFLLYAGKDSRLNHFEKGGEW